jgi:hypothetical protein
MQSAYGTPEDFEDTMVRMIKGIRRSTLLDVFSNWRKRVERCIECDGGYFD